MVSGQFFRLSITASKINIYFLWCSFSFFRKFDLFCKCLVMASSVPLVPNYVYVLIGLKMAESINSRVGTTLLCHYGETNNVVPICGLVQPSVTLIVESIRHCRHMANFRIEQISRTIAYILQKNWMDLRIMNPLK